MSGDSGTKVVVVSSSSKGGEGNPEKYVPVYPSVADAIAALAPSDAILQEVNKRKLKMNLSAHQASLAVVAKNTGRSMLRSALFAALARLALGLSKTLMKTGFKFSNKFLATLTREMGLGNPIKWGVLCAGLSSYRLLQQVLLRLGERALAILQKHQRKSRSSSISDGSNNADDGAEKKEEKEVELSNINTDTPKALRVAASFGAGMIASLPFFALNVHTRTELALYLCVRASHGIICTYWERMPMPESVKRFGHYDVVVMAVTSAEIIYALVMQGNTHLAGYQEFLLGNTKMPRNAMQVIAGLYRKNYVSEAFGIDQDYGRLGPLCAGGELAVSGATNAAATATIATTTQQLQERFNPHVVSDLCNYTHPQVSSCALNYVQYLFKHITTVSIPMYLPLKVMATLVFNMKKLKKDPVATVIKVTKGILSSSVFLTLYASVPVGSVCLFSQAGISYPPPLFAWSGFFSGLPTFLEPKGRRLDLALYCSVQTLRSVTRILHVRGYIPRPTSSWIFTLQTLAVGMVLYQYDSHADILHTNLKGTLAWLLHERPRSPKDQELELLTYIEKECMATATAPEVVETAIEAKVEVEHVDAASSPNNANNSDDEEEEEAPPAVESF